MSLYETTSSSTCRKIPKYLYSYHVIRLTPRATFCFTWYWLSSGGRALQKMSARCGDTQFFQDNSYRATDRDHLCWDWWMTQSTRRCSHGRITISFIISVCIHLSTHFFQHKHRCKVLIHFSEMPILISLAHSYSLIVLSRYRSQCIWMMDQFGYLQVIGASTIMLVVRTKVEFDSIRMWAVKKSWLSRYGCRSNVLLSISRLVVGNEV